MYKVLIVDDFELDRMNIRKIIGLWEEKNLEVIGECETGVQVLDFIEEEMPDLIISDIEMPFMNGIEMASIIREKYGGRIKIIFCTLYNEFKYAKEAIYANSYGYILKPVQSQELLNCIKDVLGDISKEYRIKDECINLKKTIDSFKPILADNFLKELLYGLNDYSIELREKIDYFNLKIKQGFLRVVYIEIDDFQMITSNQTTEQKQLLSIKVLKHIKGIVVSCGNYPLTRIDEMHYAIIVSGEENSSMKIDTYDCAQKIINNVKQINISLSISLSDTSEHFSTIKKLFEQCKYLMRYKYIIGKGKIISSEDIPNNTDLNSIDTNTLQKDIRYLLNSGSKKEIEDYMNEQINNLSETLDEMRLRNYCFLIVVCVRVVLSENKANLSEVFMDENLIWHKLQNFETILDQGNWIKNILIFSNEYLNRKSTNKNNMIVDKMKEFIQNNLYKNFGLEELASEMHYSANYLNYIFKQTIGLTISDYIINEKLSKAKEMLLDVRIRVQDISDQLGYSHAAYFCSVFKKHIGMTPKEYRERSIS